MAERRAVLLIGGVAAIFNGVAWRSGDAALADMLNLDLALWAAEGGYIPDPVIHYAERAAAAYEAEQITLPDPLEFDADVIY